MAKSNKMVDDSGKLETREWGMAYTKQKAYKREKVEISLDTDEEND